jgi:hypothetical protein
MNATPSSSHSPRVIAEAISEWIDRDVEPWFPSMSPALVAGSPAWQLIGDARAYGTARWMSGNTDGPRNVVGKLLIGGHEVLVEILPDALEQRFNHLTLVSAAEAIAAQYALVSAVGVLNEIPSLAGSVGHVVRAVHVLSAGLGYDVSHSEPTIPFSIFVSVPALGEKDSAIRVAESILHEAMHLQLTLMEEALPMVATEAEGFSPWQRRNRPVRGLLHGMYVFSVIKRFMDVVCELRPELGFKAKQRRSEIEEEVASLDDFSRHLTVPGRALYARCIDVFRDTAHVRKSLKRPMP